MKSEQAEEKTECGGCGHGSGQHGGHGEKKGTLHRILAAALIYVVLLVPAKLIRPPFMERTFQEALLFLIPWLMAGIEVIKGAVSGLLQGELLGEELLMLIASVGAFVSGEPAEAAAVMLLYSIGEFLQEFAAERTRDSVSGLMHIVPETARKETAEGGFSLISPEELVPGDTILLYAGDRIPTDGTVLSGSSRLDTRDITGEAVPRSVRPGDPVISGCINGSGLLRVRVDKALRDSTAAKILELVEHAAEKKSPMENFVTRFARIYTPVVVGAAVLLCVLGTLFGGGGILLWVRRACTFLVISCPCALVISVPLSFFVGIGAASGIGVLVKGSVYLEALAGIGVLATDKTGTLTKGEFRVTELLPAAGISEEELLEKAAFAERFSDHPAATCIREAAQEAFSRSDIRGTLEAGAMGSESIPGRGVRCTLPDHTLIAGNAAWMRENGIFYGEDSRSIGTAVHVAEDRRYLGRILISDRVKEGTEEAIREMKRLGVRKTVMLTGDRKNTAEAVAEALGIDEVYAELLPQEKAELLQKIRTDEKARFHERKREKKTFTAYAGDGMNDAPVLKTADVGIAMGSLGSDAAIEAADVVIMDDDLRRVPESMKIASRTLWIARENIVFALGAKLLVLVLCTLGITGMWAAVLADVGVALLCILNCMRILLRRKDRS